MALAALMSLAVQSFVVQTHLHLGVRGGTSAPAEPAGSVARPLRHRAHPPAPLDCPGCRQLARANAILLPPVLAPLPLGAVLAWFPVVARVSRPARVRSHDWRSRAPPAVLVTLLA